MMISETAGLAPRDSDHADRRPLMHQGREHDAAEAASPAKSDLEFFPRLGILKLAGLAVEYFATRRNVVDWHRKRILQDLIGLWRGRRKGLEVLNTIDEAEHRRRVSADQAVGASSDRFKHRLHV